MEISSVMSEPTKPSMSNFLGASGIIHAAPIAKLPPPTGLMAQMAVSVDDSVSTAGGGGNMNKEDDHDEFSDEDAE